MEHTIAQLWLSLRTRWLCSTMIRNEPLYNTIPYLAMANSIDVLTGRQTLLSSRKPASKME